MFLVDVDYHFLDWFEKLFRGLVPLNDHLWPRYSELEPLAAHGLDQDRKLQFAAPRDDIRVRSGRILDPQGDIAFGLPVKTIADDAARKLVAFGSGERRIIHKEGHRQS